MWRKQDDANDAFQIFIASAIIAMVFVVKLIAMIRELAQP